MIVKIKPCDIDKIRIYVNKYGKTKKEILKETGADYIINGGLYNGNFTPACHLKVNGKMLTNDPYRYWGYGWNNSEKNLNMTISIPEPEFDNYICCVALLKDGKKESLSYPKALGGERGRSGIGTFPDGTIIEFCSADGTKDAMTPESLQNYMLSLGCRDFIMLDSGGSSQCNFKGEEVNSAENYGRGRIVHNYILIRLKKTEEKEDSKMPNDKITKSYMTKNRCYTNQIRADKHKAMLHSTGTPGATASNIMEQWNTAKANVSVEFIIDGTGVYQLLPLGVRSWHAGASANGTHIACEICEPVETRVLPVNWYPLSKGGKNNTKYAVTLLQKELSARGYNPNGIDGSFGNGCDSALKKFQRDNKLTPDGSCGRATLALLQKRDGSFLKYPKDKVQPYFDKVYSSAVYLYAWLMKEINGNPDEIICHSEGYSLGIASNHADVMHWFPEHGKTMDTFRADVKKAMSKEDAKPEPKPEPLSDLEQAIQKFVNRGIISSPDYWAGNDYSAENVRQLIIKTAKVL